MSWREVPFTQWAGIHMTDDFISVEPLSGYRRTLREDECYIIYLEPDATEESLGKVLLEALDRSRFVHPNIEREFFEADRMVRAQRRWESDMMKRFRYKTKRQAYKSMRYCITARTGGKISIKPHRRDEKPGYITDVPEDRTVIIPVTTDPVVAGTALKLALSHCE